MDRLIVKLRRYVSGSKVLLQDRNDYQFLPSVLELTETPNSPTKIVVMLFICTFFTLFLLWAYFSVTDIVTTAYGKVLPMNRVSIVQALETARVAKIFVKNGQLVHTGDTLFVLDSREVEKELEALKLQKFTFEKEASRRLLINQYTKDFNDQSATLECIGSEFEYVCAREKNFFEELMNKIKVLKNFSISQMEQKISEKNKFNSMIGSTKDLLEVLQERIGVFSNLYDNKTGNLVGLLQAKEGYQTQLVNLLNYKGQVDEADKNINLITADYEKNIEAIIADNNEKLLDLFKKINDLQMSINKDEIKLQNNTIRTTTNGFTTGLTIFNDEQIVLAGQELARVVPDNNEYVVQAYVENREGGFVHEGQEAYIKVDMFPFTKYGMVPAHISSVSKDSFDLSDIENKSRFPQRSIDSNLPGGSEVHKNLVFPIDLEIDSMRSNNGAIIPLSAGMTVSVEIKTGSRRLIEYFLSSLLELRHNSFKEN